MFYRRVTAKLGHEGEGYRWLARTWSDQPRGETAGAPRRAAESRERGRVGGEEQPAKRAPPTGRAEQRKDGAPEKAARDALNEAVAPRSATDQALGVRITEAPAGGPGVLGET